MLSQIEVHKNVCFGLLKCSRKQAGRKIAHRKFVHKCVKVNLHKKKIPQGQMLYAKMLIRTNAHTKKYPEEKMQNYIKFAQEKLPIQNNTRTF